MGDWNTLHLFDESAYQKETLTILQSPDLMTPYFREYLKSCLGGTCEWTPALITAIFRSNASVFNDLTNITSDHTEKKFQTPYGTDDYHFRRFINFLLFNTCVDFYPYFKLGKSLVQRSIDLNWKTVSGEILSTLFNHSSQFNWDGDGIRKILLPKELGFLLTDSKNIVPSTPEAKPMVDEFLFFLNFAQEHGLGLLSGQNIEDRMFQKRTSSLSSKIKANAPDKHQLIIYHTE